MGTIKSAHKDPLFFLGSLVSSLAHELRSPLSVLVNDLTYLKSAHPNENIDRTLAQVDKISGLLKEICKVGGGTLDLQSWPMKEVLAVAGFDTSNCSEARVRLDRGLTALALQWLVELLDGLPNGAKTEVNTAPGSLEFYKLISPSVKGDFSSLTSFVAESHQSSMLMAPLIDAIFEAQLIELKISSGDRLAVKLQFK